MNRGIVIYNDWLPLIRRLPDALRGKVFTAVLEFSESGEYAETGDPAADMLLAVMCQRIGADIQKYEDVIKSRSEGGKKGMEKRWGKSDNSVKQVITCDNSVKQVITPITQHNFDNNTNTNSNTNTNTNSNSKKKSTLTCAKKEIAAEAAAPAPQTRLERFTAWLSENCPYIYEHYKMPSDVLLAKLINTYGAEQVAEQCLNIENRTDLRRRYTNLYQTLNNWLKRETELNKKYGRDRQYNQEGRAERAEGVAQLIQRLADEDDQRAGARGIQPIGAA